MNFPAAIEIAPSVGGFFQGHLPPARPFFPMKPSLDLLFGNENQPLVKENEVIPLTVRTLKSLIPRLSDVLFFLEVFPPSYEYLPGDT